MQEFLENGAEHAIRKHGMRADDIYLNGIPVNLLCHSFNEETWFNSIYWILKHNGNNEKSLYWHLLMSNISLTIYLFFILFLDIWKYDKFQATVDVVLQYLISWQW